MGLLLDIVPNHMAASSENPWWMDVLENGAASEYAEFFDIDWHPATGKAAFLQENRVLLPILGDLYGNVLRNQEMTLRIDDNGLFVRYYDNRLPLDPKTYGTVVRRALELDPGPPGVERAAGRDRPPARARRDRPKPNLRPAHRASGPSKSGSGRRTSQNPDVKRAIDEAIRRNQRRKG